ncbi:MAG: putative manganese transporter [Armatimonadota bacterium]
MGAGREIADLVILSAADSFLQVGVFVGALLVLFGYINYRTAGGLIRAIEHNRPWQPLLGALLGVSPGCGGAIFVMPLYIRGVCSYGTLVATLIATMGDSSFVILSRLPREGLIVHGLSFVVGVITGYAVDALRIGVRVPAAASSGGTAGEAAEGRTDQPHPHVSHEEGDEVHDALHPPEREVPGTLGYELTHRGYVVYWAITAVGFVVGVVMLAQRDVESVFGLNLRLIVGPAGAMMSMVWMLAARHFLGDDTHAEAEEKQGSLKETLIHNAHETAFVTFWVFVAYVAYGGIIIAVGEGALERLVTAAGVLSPIAAAAIGLIPGCGPQIVTVTLYCERLIPFSALLANAISQDGDALFPVLAMDRRVALTATITTTVPAIICGCIAFYIERAL